MLIFVIAPVYVIINLYILKWIYSWFFILHPMTKTRTFKISFGSLYGLIALTPLTSFLVTQPEWLHRFLKSTSNYFLGAFLYLILCVIVADILRLLLKYVFKAGFIRSRKIFAAAGALCMAITVLLVGYGIWNERQVQVTPYTVTVPKEVPGMDGLNVVLVSDTHFGYSIGTYHAKEMAEKINAQHPDLVLFAGDLFDNDFNAIADPEGIKTALKGIRSTYGTYACWGNHDINEPILGGFTFGGSELKASDQQVMEDFLKDCGMTLLNDEAVLMDDKFYVVGRKDASRSKKLENGRLSPDELLAPLDQSKPIIVIDHQPKELDALSSAGADLDLCGHTHDGQVFPGNLLIHLFWENTCGYLKKGNMHNIVTSGLGIWGPNMRVGTKSEICNIRVDFVGP